MHGLMNRAIQGFLRVTYGTELWLGIASETGIPPAGFEAMLHYDPVSTENMLNAAARALGRSRETILEDIGTWLVSSHSGQPLRRLLRFGGVNFVDFLYSLEELPGRAKLALPDLGVPAMELREPAPRSFTLTVGGTSGFGHVLVGVLRAMADDYGALVILEHIGLDGPHEVIAIQLVITDHSEGRTFQLAGDV